MIIVVFHHILVHNFIVDVANNDPNDPYKKAAVENYERILQSFQGQLDLNYAEHICVIISWVIC